MIELKYLWELPIVYIGLFLFFVFVKTLFNKSIIDKILFCNVCASWFTYMIYGFFLYPLIISAFQIGLSMTGISMYLKEEKDKRKIEMPFDFFILQLMVTLIGISLIIIKSIYFNNI